MEQGGIGARIRLHRRRLGLPQKTLAQLVARSERWLREVEAGRTHPRLHEVTSLATALRIDAGRLLDGAPVRSVDPEDDDVKRRDFVRLGVLGVGSAFMSGLPGLDWERLAALPGHLDARVLDDLEEMTSEFARRTHVAQPGTLLIQVHNHLAALRSMLNEPRPEALERRLQSAAGETARLAGWLGYLTEARGAANAYYDLGIDLARQAENGGLLARILVAKSLLYSSASHDLGHSGTSASVVGILDEAAAVGGEHVPARLRSWIFERRAEEHAAGGRAAEAMADMETAERVIDSSFAEGLPTNWDSVWFDVYLAHVHRLLGQPRESIPLLQGALKDIDQQLSYDRAVFLTGLSAAYAQLDPPQVDEAAAALVAALDLAIDRRLAGRVQRIFAIRRQLTPWQDSAAVKALDDRLQTARW